MGQPSLLSLILFFSVKGGQKRKEEEKENSHVQVRLPLGAGLADAGLEDVLGLLDELAVQVDGVLAHAPRRVVLPEDVLARLLVVLRHPRPVRLALVAQLLRPRPVPALVRLPRLCVFLGKRRSLVLVGGKNTGLHLVSDAHRTRVCWGRRRGGGGCEKGKWGGRNRRRNEAHTRSKQSFRFWASARARSRSRSYSASASFPGLWLKAAANQPAP